MSHLEERNEVKKEIYLFSSEAKKQLIWELAKGKKTKNKKAKTQNSTFAFV